ncbi:hypothetical protein K1728_05355 [Weissella confusa]|uniref:hypothetical protein n=1 Tax=Weissella confusa TaxID=1583 RepID=UPI001C6F66F1|nr:hypothetical protein [Weissella confusa]QYU58825.1 hypothetical protein K1728_05355 [Weissella confusa]
MKRLEVKDLLPYGLMYSENGALHQEVLDNARQAYQHFQRVYVGIQSVATDELIDMLDRISQDLAEIFELSKGRAGDNQRYTRLLYSAVLDYFVQKDLLTDYLKKYPVYVE